MWKSMDNDNVRGWLRVEERVGEAKDMAQWLRYLIQNYGDWSLGSWHLCNKLGIPENAYNCSSEGQRQEDCCELLAANLVKAPRE